jgi:protein SCO1/2
LACGSCARSQAAPRPAAPAAQDSSGLPFYATADLTAEWADPGSARDRSMHRIAPFALRGQDGQTVTHETLRGKVYVANFFFTSCQGICPKMLKNLRAIQDAFAGQEDVVLVSHTVMPSVDSQEVLQAYAKANGIRSGKWHLLTGPKETIYDLARRSYFAEKRLGSQKGDSEFLHTENMLLIDQQGRIRGVYNATLPMEAERAMEDIRLLLGPGEAPAGPAQGT